MGRYEPEVLRMERRDEPAIDGSSVQTRRLEFRIVNGVRRGPDQQVIGIRRKHIHPCHPATVVHKNFELDAGAGGKSGRVARDQRSCLADCPGGRKVSPSL